ncbi:hypothetical protein ACFSX9_11710 [Flavobacterium ardleyense]|uniref:Lipoprotein n=1 Tax=Flavobacterium ardleyense TaxID=2038737 RepID=A0ABW5Z941_9FLAO
MSKRITLMLVFIGMITLQSCTVNEVKEGPDKDTISEVFEYSNVNLTNSNDYSRILNFPFAIYPSDMVLVYRLTGLDSNRDVWKLLPETYYYDDGTLNFGYKNDFTRVNAVVELFGYDLPGLNPDFRLNQVFRVVVIPGSFASRTAAFNFEDYEAVVERYQLDEANVIKIQE